MLATVGGAQAQGADAVPGADTASIGNPLEAPVTLQEPPADTAAQTPTAPSLVRDSLATRPAESSAVQVTVPDVVLRGVPFGVTLTGLDTADGALVRAGGRTVPVEVADDGTLSASGLTAPDSGPTTVEVLWRGGAVATATPRTLPGWLSIVPPLLAIAVALVWRRVIPALFLGIWSGAVLVAGVTPGGIVGGLFATIQVYILDALADEGHASIVIFTLMIGGMVGIIQKNGGTQGVVNAIVRWASTPKRGQTATGLLGLTIFFDDYANSLIIGNTMRPVTDRLRISREKLAYIVDSTSAPVASLALVTTWIGFEVGLINEAVAGIPGLTLDGYGIFLESILYRFYPILALFFVFVIAFTDREFGPMYDAEHRARTTGAVLGPGAKVDAAAEDSELFAPPPDKPHRGFNAILPVLVLVFGVIVGLWVTGEGDTIREVIGSADSYKALMWSSLAGVLTAVLLSVGQRILTLDETLDSWYEGLKSMLFAMIILVLAWSLSATTDVLHTGDYLGTALSAALPPGIVPALIFVLAALTAFATGTSWGTMGILMPLVVQLMWGVMDANGLADPEHFYLLYSAVSCVLAGAVWGDHCSPISDTTILSSMASGCDHIEHVRTQLPYALLVGLVAIGLGTIPTGFGFPWWLSLLLGAGVLLAVLWFFGKPIPGHTEEVEVDEA
ncbi:Na+/H+ antiporter NhaC family protein [Rubrivirga marina]|uniref:Na+/H+ antiporter NhaC family protein n=1 Tax=Rubrivirga marina TaxID=1196024 RepID=UPI001C52724E|nr:Na+/H+ antiporter NhaC family protein [Rubrivirga marina]